MKLLKKLDYNIIYLPNVMAINYVEEKKEFELSTKPQIERTDGTIALVSLKVQEHWDDNNPDPCLEIRASIAATQFRGLAKLTALSTLFFTILGKLYSASAGVGKLLFAAQDNGTIAYILEYPGILMKSSLVSDNASVVNYIKDDLNASVIVPVNSSWGVNVNAKSPNQDQ